MHSPNYPATPAVLKIGDAPQCEVNNEQFSLTNLSPTSGQFPHFSVTSIRFTDSIAAAAAVNM